MRLEHLHQDLRLPIVVPPYHLEHIGVTIPRGPVGRVPASVVPPLQPEPPAAVRRVYHAWGQMYWLAKSNRICAGALTTEEKVQAQQILEDV